MTEDGVIRILHWNVHSWIDPESGESNTGLVEQAIRDLQPDVVSLVEVDEQHEGPSSLDRLAESVGFRSIFAPTFEYGEAEPRGAFGNALLTRLPIHEVRQWQLTWPDTSYDGTEASEPRTAVVSVLEAAAGRVCIACAHLPRGNADSRDRALSYLFQRLRWVSDSWLVCGDFNTAPPVKTPFRIAPAPAVPTYPAQEPAEAIDWSVASSGDLQAEVLTVRVGSDHLPILIHWRPSA